jgi:hydrogenase-4 component B
MTWILLGLGVWVVTGAGALLLGRSARYASWTGAGGVVVGALLAMGPVLRVMMGGDPEFARARWLVPYGAFSVELDGLSAWFMAVLLVLGPLAAVYAFGYFGSRREGRPLGVTWFFFNLLVASIGLVLLSRNAVLFLAAWEVMSLTSFFLVTQDDETEETRAAGKTYLVATHLGTGFLMVLFVVLGRESGSLEFGDWAGPGRLAPGTAGVLFLLALVGFGTKAGLAPFHTWLPEAHPAAPSPVSALMSAVMIKTGIYGLIRMMTLIESMPRWCAWVLIGVGSGSALFGVLFALAQRDLKRLLAYSSVENAGIIVMALGIGVLGWKEGHPGIFVAGMGGALLHVWNHALFKGLLFFGAGAAMRATGTRDVEALGGLMKRMPWSGSAFVVGAAAIVGLPPLNGFVSEFLVFRGGYLGVVGPTAWMAVAGVMVVGVLALVSGLAAACFARAAGMVWLGEPRGSSGDGGHEPSWAMRGPMVGLASGCVVMGLAAPIVMRPLGTVLGGFGVVPGEVLVEELVVAGRVLVSVTVLALVWIGLVALVAWLRRGLLSGRSVGTVTTWDCGYARPTVRMQYTASSFGRPLTLLFGWLVGTRRKATPLEGYFPVSVMVTTETPDRMRALVYGPCMTLLERVTLRLRWLQGGHLQLYVLYVGVTLLVLLLWKLR